MDKRYIEEEITRLIKRYITDELSSNNVIVVDEDAIDTIVTDAIESFFDEVENGISDLVDEAEVVEDDDNDIDKDDFWKNCY